MKTTAQGPFRDAPIPFHDTPLPDGLTVFRVGSSVRIDKETRPGQETHIAYIAGGVVQMTTADEKGRPPHLSMWCRQLTTPEEAWLLLGGRVTNDCLYEFVVDDVRAIRIDPNKWANDLKKFVDLAMVSANDEDRSNFHARLMKAVYEPMDVRWFDTDAKGPGAEGHAGVTNLDMERDIEGVFGDRLPEKKVSELKGIWTASRKQLRLGLARAASGRITLSAPQAQSAHEAEGEVNVGSGSVAH